MLFSPSIFQHLLWVLHTTLGSNPVAMCVEYAGIHQASKTLQNTLGFIGIPEYKLVKPSERLDHIWNTKKNIRQINSFFLTWHTLWPKLTKETFHSFASKPHTYELVDPQAQQWFNISKDPSYTSPTIQPRHQTPLLEKAKIRHSLALHENQHLATAVNPQFECKKWKKKLLEIKKSKSEIISDLDKPRYKSTDLHFRNESIYLSVIEYLKPAQKLAFGARPNEVGPPNNFWIQTSHIGSWWIKP